MIRRPRQLWILALATAGRALVAAAQPSPAVTSLVVVLDDNYPPYVFRDATGAVKGILPDQWALWEQKTGVRVDLRAMDWAAAQNVMRAGGADVIDTVFVTEERARIYDFTPPYAEIQVPIYAHKSLGGLADVDSLKGFTIGVKAGDAVIERLAANGIDTLREYPSYEEIVLAAKRQEIKVFSIDEPAGVYFLYKHAVANEFKTAMILYTGQLHRAVAKDRRDLLALVNRGFADINGREYRAIERKWLGSPFRFLDTFREWLPFLVAAAGAVLLLATGNLVLRHKVRAGTAELRRAMDQLRRSLEEQRLAEAQLRSSREYLATVIDSIHDALMIHDVETGRLLDANRRACEMSGYSREEMLTLGLGPMCAGTPPHTLREVEEWNRKAATEGPQIVEFQARHRDGHLFWVETRIRKVTIEGRARLLVLIRDISDRKIAEEEHQRLESRMREAERMESLGLLAGGIAHDFNNLLAAIMGNLDLALLSLPPETPARDDILAAGISTRKAAELVQQMLAYSGRSRIVAEHMDVAAMLHRAAQTAQASLPAQVTLQLHVPAPLPAIEADESLLRQVILNLILNAVESMENRAGAIDLSAGVMDRHELPALPLWPHASLPPGAYVFVAVADTGAGIPADRLGRIFEPFYSTKFTGRGLGLPAVLGIVRGHKGAIQIESTPGKGSTFRLYFPVAPGPA